MEPFMATGSQRVLLLLLLLVVVVVFKKTGKSRKEV
jgi:hypothetical protein